MRVYLDSSAVLKRVLAEAESADLVVALDKHHAEGDVLVSSSLAWIEVARALRSLRHATLPEVADDVDAALSGVAEHPLVAEVVALARRVSPAVLRSPDAIHLASALLLDVGIVLTYDQRLAAACIEGGLAVGAPGSDSVPTTRTGAPPD
ncbi:MAG: type II toxin-antitoxin system VapC family toxin [Pseudonocardiaceae bacterium]